MPVVLSNENLLLLLQNWIGFKKQLVTDKKEPATTKIKVAERKTRARDVFFKEFLAGNILSQTWCFRQLDGCSVQGLIMTNMSHF
jgi:hypothetical protein